MLAAVMIILSHTDVSLTHVNRMKKIEDFFHSEMIGLIHRPVLVILNDGIAFANVIGSCGRRQEIRNVDQEGWIWT